MPMNTLFLTIIVAVILLLGAMLAMGVKALFVKNGRFPSGHVCRHDFTSAKPNPEHANKQK